MKRKELEEKIRDLLVIEYEEVGDLDEGVKSIMSLIDQYFWGPKS